MRVPIIMPQLGESIAEATIVSIAVKPGDQVAADQEIIEVETNKALLHVTTPCAGEIAELLAEPQGTYEVGATLGIHRSRIAEEAVAIWGSRRRAMMKNPPPRCSTWNRVRPSPPATATPTATTPPSPPRPNCALSCPRTALRAASSRRLPGPPCPPGGALPGSRSRRVWAARVICRRDSRRGWRNWASARPIWPPCPAAARPGA